MTKYYTMIGSRNTPRDIMETLSDIAKTLAALGGYIGRSGGAAGADQAMENGLIGRSSAFSEIYLPWNGFNRKYAGNWSFIDAQSLPNYQQAQQIASETHPAWHNCNRTARAFHTRNVYQILGLDLDTPSTIVICYAEPSGNKGYVKGGTATAVKIAIDRGIPVLNLAVPGWEDKLMGLEEI